MGWEDDGTLDGLMAVTAEWLDSVRRQALRQGLRPLDQYDLLSSRWRRVCTSAATAREATSKMHALMMQVAGRPAAPSSSVCSDAERLAEAVAKCATLWGVTPTRATARWLDACHRQTGYLVALLRQAAATRRAEFEEREAVGVGPAEGAGEEVSGG